MLKLTKIVDDEHIDQKIFLCEYPTFSLSQKSLKQEGSDDEVVEEAVENKSKVKMNTRKRKLDNTTYTNNNNKKLKRCFNPFDRTSIHPESYAIADKLLKYMELSPELIGSNEMAKVTRQMNPKGDKKYLHSVKSLIF